MADVEGGTPRRSSACRSAPFSSRTYVFLSSDFSSRAASTRSAVPGSTARLNGPRRSERSLNAHTWPASSTTEKLVATRTGQVLSDLFRSPEQRRRLPHGVRVGRRPAGATGQPSRSPAAAAPGAGSWSDPRLVVGLVLGEHLHRVDTRVRVDNPVMFTAEQHQILHRVDVVPELGVSCERGPCRPTPTIWARCASVTGCSPGS